MMFGLRFPEDQIARWANRYTYLSEDRIANEIAPAARERGYWKRTEFIEICKWKTPRSQPLVQANSLDVVEGSRERRSKAGLMQSRSWCCRRFVVSHGQRLQRSCTSVIRSPIRSSTFELSGLSGTRRLPRTLSTSGSSTRLSFASYLRERAGRCGLWIGHCGSTPMSVNATDPAV